MRFTTLFTSLSLAVAAYAMPLVTRTEDSVSSATDILNNLNSELLTISNDIRKAGILRLKPYRYDIPLGVNTAVGKAIKGIEELPELTSQENIPQNVVDRYAPLVDMVGETVFATLIDLKQTSQRVLKNDKYTQFTNQADEDIYALVRALNSRYQGFTCDLSKKAGQKTLLGQVLKELSDDLFHIIFDAIEGAQC